MQPAASTKKKAIIAGALVGAFSLWWYFNPFPWLGVVMGLLAGLFTFYILSTRRVEQLRRAFVIGLFVVTFGALVVIIFFDTGFNTFMRWIEMYELAYYLPGQALGVNNIPNVLLIPQVLLGRAEFVLEQGFWQTYFPSSPAEFFLIMTPYFIISLMFGRAFCGWLCPFGGLPEVMTTVKKKRWQLNFLKKKTTTTRGFRYAGLKEWVNNTKYGILLAVILLSIFLGFPLVFIFSLPLWLASMPIFWTLIGILVVFAIVLPFMTKRRWWCHICPVGAVMSLLHKFSLFRVALDEKKCTQCMACVPACQMYALTSDDVKGAGAPNAHCIRCGRCIEVCPVDAIDISFMGRYRKVRALFIPLVIATAFASYIWFIVFLAYYFSSGRF